MTEVFHYHVGDNIEDAIAQAKHRLDTEYANQLEDERNRMLEDGLSLDVVNEAIDRRIEMHIAMRNRLLDELQGLLLRHQKRLH